MELPRTSQNEPEPARTGQDQPELARTSKNWPEPTNQHKRFQAREETSLVNTFCVNKVTTSVFQCT